MRAEHSLLRVIIHSVRPESQRWGHARTIETMLLRVVCIRGYHPDARREMEVGPQVEP